MKKWIKLGVVFLVVTSAALISLSCAERVWYDDLRDYYPFGLYIKARKLTYVPINYTIIENDIYIEQAITSGNLTWVQQDDWNSTFVSKGFPKVILWVPEESYYRLDKIYKDGIPESWKYLPTPLKVTQLLSIPWAVFLAILSVTHLKRRGND